MNVLSMSNYLSFFAMGWISWCLVFTFYRVNSGSRGWHKHITPLAVAFGWLLLPALVLSLSNRRLSRILVRIGWYYSFVISVFLWWLPVFTATLYAGIEFDSGKNGFTIFFFDTAAFVYYY